MTQSPVTCQKTGRENKASEGRRGSTKAVAKSRHKSKASNWLWLKKLRLLPIGSNGVSGGSLLSLSIHFICPLAFLSLLVASFFLSCGLDEGERSGEIHQCPYEVFEKNCGITVCFHQTV